MYFYQRLRDLREDEVIEGMDIDDVMINSPNTNKGFFVVPKVVD